MHALPIFITTRLGNQSESSTREPSALAANQNRVLRQSSRQNRVLRHPRTLGSGGETFLALGSSRLL